MSGVGGVGGKGGGDDLLPSRHRAPVMVVFGRRVKTRLLFVVIAKALFGLASPHVYQVINTRTPLKNTMTTFFCLFDFFCHTQHSVLDTDTGVFLYE